MFFSLMVWFVNFWLSHYRKKETFVKAILEFWWEFWISEKRYNPGLNAVYSL